MNRVMNELRAKASCEGYSHYPVLCHRPTMSREQHSVRKYFLELKITVAGGEAIRQIFLRAKAMSNLYFESTLALCVKSTYLIFDILHPVFALAFPGPII